MNNNYIIKEISSDALLNILTYCYYKLYNLEIVIMSELNIVNETLDLKFYYIYNNEKIYLSQDDIFKCLESYTNEIGYFLENFKYIGGIHKVGYYYEYDTPYFDGIDLYLSLTKKNNNNLKKYIKK